MDEFAYFPHPIETRTFETGVGNVWKIDFSIGNKNSKQSNTRYGVETNLDPETLKAGDSVSVGAQIFYTPFE